MKARTFAKKMIDMIKSPEMRVLPGQLAFFIVMALIPLVAIIRVLTIKLGIPLTEIAFGEAIPKDVMKLLNNMDGATMNFNIVTFFILGFVLASNGAHSMIITSNEIYHIKSRDFLSRRVKAVLMTMLIVGLFLFLLLVPVFGDQIFEAIKANVNNKHTVNVFYNIYQIIKFPLMIVILFLNIKLIYVMAPDIKIKSSTTTKGALFTTIGWIIVSEFYSLYTTYFVRYDVFYGSLSSILILLIWVYFLSYIFSLGLIINASGDVEVIKVPKDKEVIQVEEPNKTTLILRDTNNTDDDEIEKNEE